MKGVKLWSVLFAFVLLCVCIVGVLIMGTSATDGVKEWKVDGTDYTSIYEALTAAQGETWAEDESLVITVDPSKLASESISHSASGTAYAGGIAFGQKTIFRADGTRLPITIQGSSDRTEFTLNITTDTKVACANSYTFKNLTFPIGDASNNTHIYAGSGQVKFENVATGSGTNGIFAADTFTARVFDGWTADEIQANDDLNDKIRTTMTFGTGFKYVHSNNAPNICAVMDSDGWDTYDGVTVIPEDTSAELVLDGGEIGYFRGRRGTNPVAESIQRVESGNLASVVGCGTYNKNDLYADRAQYTGDVTVIFNGGQVSSSVRLIHTAQINGNFNIEINGGIFKGYFQCGFEENVVTEDFCLKITGGDFQDTASGFYAHPSARVEGESIVDISGGTFAGLFRGTHGAAKNESGTSVRHGDIAINVKPNEKGADKDPVFNGAFYAVCDSAVQRVTLDISGGTFNGNVYGANNKDINVYIQTTVSGGIFNGAFYGGAAANVKVTAITNTIKGGTFNSDFYGGGALGTNSSIKNVVSGGTFNGLFMGAGGQATITTVKNDISGGTFNNFFMGAGVTSSVNGDVINTIFGGTFNKPVFGGACNAAISGTVTNQLSGLVTFTKGFFGAHGTNATEGTTGAVVNNIYADENGEAPKFLNPSGETFTYDSVTYAMSDVNGYCFIGGTSRGAITGTVTTTVQAGEFGTSEMGIFNGGTYKGTLGTNDGTEKDKVVVSNVIEGGVFHFRFYGGGSYGGTINGAIQSEVSGGTFESEVTAGNRETNAIKYPIIMTVTGGEFLHNVYVTCFGYSVNQVAKQRVQYKVELNVEGGVFRGDIYGLGNYGGASGNNKGTAIEAGASVNVNLYGGAFYGNIYPTSEQPVESRIVGTASVNIQPKCGDVFFDKKLESRFAAEKYAIKGGEHKILLDAQNFLKATSIEGEVNVEQINKWKNATYLILPEGHSATVNVSTKKGASGCFETVLGENGEIIEICGAPLPMGAAMVLTDRIALKFQLSKDAVDAVEDFTYSFTLPDGSVLAEGTKSDLKHLVDLTEFEYYTLNLKALGISQFDTPITVNIKGLWVNGTLSIATLANSAVTAWDGNENWVTMAKAIVNMSKAAKGEDLPYALTPDAVIYERKTPTRDQEALVTFEQKNLLMSSAVGIRLGGTVENAADAQGLLVKVNGRDVTNLAAIKVDGSSVTVDMYFSAYGMGKEFSLEIFDKNGKNCLTMFERLDSFATEYGAENKLAYSLLSYIQATSTMARSTPLLNNASEEEIAILNEAYAGRNVYYGDIHCHPMAGVTHDGKNTLAEWKVMMEEKNLDFVAFLNHKQVYHMYEDDWDDTLFIGGTEPASYIIDNTTATDNSIHYNMIFPDPTDLLEILEEFPEFEYTGGKNGIEYNKGTFIYPELTTARMQELIAAVKSKGGFWYNVHPKQQMKSEYPLDYYFADYTGLEVFYGYYGSITGQDTKDNYKLWCDLLAQGKRLWATSGSDIHDLNNDISVALDTVYSEEKKDDVYLEKFANGDFTAGFAGIRMTLGEAKMGGHTDFAGKKLIFSVGDIYDNYLAKNRAYRVNVITDKGIAFTCVIDGSKTTYFSLDADESAKFYRIEVLDELIEEQPIIALGNPIWND